MTDPTGHSPVPRPATDNRLDEIEELFDQVDGDGDQRIDLPEFTTLMRDLDPGMSEATLAIGFREVDGDRDGQIDFAEFRDWWLAR